VATTYSIWNDSGRLGAPWYDLDGRSRLSERYGGSLDRGSSRVSGWKLRTWPCGISSALCAAKLDEGCGFGILTGFSSFGSIGSGRVFCPQWGSSSRTVVRWHRRGFGAFWRYKSRGRSGRPRILKEKRDRIHEVSLANPLRGAPRIHGELSKVGIDVAQSTVAKYMVKGRRPPSQSWKTFLRNHADRIASINFFVIPAFVVPAAAFKLLYAFVVLRHDRRRLVHVAVTTGRTADWIARQISEAFPWETAPSYLIRDRDGAYGQVFR
jgi:hypothetical protein